MKIGDLVIDKELNEMGIITEIIFVPDSDDEACAVVTLADGQSVLAKYEELELIACNL
tara:strand:- start:718 stop:891 length:174 start_codon:yes stop_codon:yes gene_type:complete